MANLALADSPNDITLETINAVRMAQADTTRAITTSTGLLGYVLQAPSL